MLFTVKNSHSLETLLLTANTNTNLWMYVHIFSRVSAKAEHDLSNLSDMFLCVELGDLLEIAYPLGIPWFQVWIWIHHKNLS